MDGGLSVGGIASIGVAAGASFGVQPAANLPPALAPAAPMAASTNSLDVVVNISGAGMRALALDAPLSSGNAAPSRLTDDLAALALLAILQRDQQQSNSMINAAAAVAAYIAVQSLISA